MPTARPKAFLAVGTLRGMLALAADLLLPPVCISCRKRAGAHGLLCGGCWAKIDFIAPPLCLRLGVPLPYDTGEPSLSVAAIADPPVYDRARAARVIPRPCATSSRASNMGIATRACRCLGVDGGCRRRAPRRRRRDRAGSPLPVEALVAALHPVGLAGTSGSRQHRGGRMSPGRFGSPSRGSKFRASASSLSTT